MPATSTKSKKPLVITIIIIFLAAIIGFGAWWLLNQNSTVQNNEQSLLTLMEDFYDDLTSVQRTFISAAKNDSSANNFFSNTTKNNLETIVDKVQTFSNQLSDINLRNFDDDVRADTEKLSQKIQQDLPIYTNTLNLYNLFYDYAEHDYDATYRTPILELQNAKATTALEKLDNYYATYDTIRGSTIVKDLFSVYVDEDFSNGYYYEYIGKIIAELKNEQ